MSAKSFYSPDIDTRIHEALSVMQCGLIKCRTNDEWDVVFASQSFYDLIGYTDKQFAEECGNKLAKLFVDKKSLSEIKKSFSNLKLNEVSNEEYTLLKRDGRKVDVLDKSVMVQGADGERFFYSTLMDVTLQRKNSYDKDLFNKKLEIAIEHARMFYWEYDVVNSVYHKTQNNSQEFFVRTGVNTRSEIKDFPIEFIRLGYVADESTEDFLRIHDDLKQGKKNSEANIHFAYDSMSAWLRIQYTNLFDENGKPYLAIGTAINIDSLVELEEEFEVAASNEGIDIWTYDIVKKQLMIPQNAQKKYRHANHIVKNVPESIIQNGWVHPDDVTLYCDSYKRLDQGEKSVSIRVRLKTFNKNGDEIWNWNRVTFNNIFDKDNKPIRAIGSSVVINRLVEAEAHYAAFANYRAVAGIDTIASFRINVTKNKCIDFNSKLKSIPLLEAAITVDEFLEAVKNGLPYEEDVELLANGLSRNNLLNLYESGKHTTSAEVRYRIAENKIIWINITCSLVENPDTREIECLVNATDINDEKIMSSIIDRLVGADYNMIATIDLKSEEFKVVSVFDGVVRVMPDSEKNKYSDLLEVNLRALSSDKNVDEVIEQWKLQNLLSKLGDSDSYSFSFPIKGKHKMYYGLAKVGYLDTKKSTLLLTTSDITELREVEIEQREILQKALDDAQAASEAKSDFLSRMSHDMRTPMNGILGILNLIKDEKMSDVLRANLRKMEIASEYLLCLINDTLDMNKIESNKIELVAEPVRSRELIESISAAVRSVADEKKINSRILTENYDDSVVMIDKVRVQQIFNNILSNAIKFTPAGGSVECTISRLKIENGVAHDRITVRDSGIGMSKEFLGKIFEPFEQEHNDVNMNVVGTGLGMSIVKNLVTLMGGKIEVSSELGVGTDVSVWLDFPIASEQAFEGGKEADLTALDGARLLLCEDHPLNAEIARRLLEKKGSIIDLATDGKKGLEMFKASKVNYYDAVLMDIRMPVMDGIEATKQIRAVERPDAKTVPIIAMTANAFDEDVKEAKSAGMNAHLAKPIEPDVMFKTIATYVEKKKRL